MRPLHPGELRVAASPILCYPVDMALPFTFDGKTFVTIAESSPPGILPHPGAVAAQVRAYTYLGRMFRSWYLSYDPLLLTLLPAGANPIVYDPAGRNPTRDQACAAILLSAARRNLELCKELDAAKAAISSSTPVVPVAIPVVPTPIAIPVRIASTLNAGIMRCTWTQTGAQSSNDTLTQTEAPIMRNTASMAVAATTDASIETLTPIATPYTLEKSTSVSALIPTPPSSEMSRVASMQKMPSASNIVELPKPEIRNPLVTGARTSRDIDPADLEEDYVQPAVVATNVARPPATSYSQYKSLRDMDFIDDDDVPPSSNTTAGVLSAADVEASVVALSSVSVGIDAPHTITFEIATETARAQLVDCGVGLETPIAFAENSTQDDPVARIDVATDAIAFEPEVAVITCTSVGVQVGGGDRRWGLRMVGVFP